MTTSSRFAAAFVLLSLVFAPHLLEAQNKQKKNQEDKGPAPIKALMIADLWSCNKLNDDGTPTKGYEAVSVVTISRIRPCQ